MPSVELTTSDLRTFLADYIEDNNLCQSSYTPQAETITGLINKIGEQFTIQSSFTNPLAMLDYGTLPLGADVEEYLDALLLPEAYSNHALDDGETIAEDELAPRYAIVDKCYHLQQEPFKFVKTVDIDQVKQAFISPEALANFYASMMIGITNAKTVSAFTQSKMLLGKLIGLAQVAHIGGDYLGYNYGITAPTDETTAKAFIKKVKENVLNVQFPVEGYTLGNHTSQASKENLVLVLNKSVIASIQVDGRSNAFNVAELDFGVDTVIVDDWGGITEASTTIGLLIDRRGVRVYKDIDTVLETVVGSGRYRNYFDHNKFTLVLSKFATVVVFDTGAEPQGN